MINQKFYGAATIYHEAANQPVFGQVCVAHVILNRCLIRNMSVKEVVYEPAQFSCYNKNKNPPIDDYKSMVRAEKAFQRAIDERLYGYNYFDADHYHADYMDPFPEWSEHPEMIRVSHVFSHIFYRWEG